LKTNGTTLEWYSAYRARVHPAGSYCKKLAVSLVEKLPFLFYEQWLGCLYGVVLLFRSL
jgi:hypothetical protein